MSGHFMHTREMVGTIIIDDSTSVSILDDVDITFSSDFDMLEFNCGVAPNPTNFL